MNTKQAKAEPLPDFLGRLGFTPTSIRGNDVWYKSPFRPTERTPSFKVDRTKNVWYDHGLGTGGTIVDFMQHLNQTTDIARVLSDIEGILGSPARASVVMPAVERPRTPPEIDSVSRISDPTLERYLTSRAIPVDLARLYLKEISYRVEGLAFKALGFGNDAGGFEVRNASFKGTLGKKDLTYLAKGTGQQVAVFEGFFDFLSVLTHYQRDSAKTHVLVLNSLAMIEQAATRLNHENARKLYTYFDHDAPGLKGVNTLRERGAWDVADMSDLYREYKDVNDFLR